MNIQNQTISETALEELKKMAEKMQTFCQENHIPVSILFPEENTEEKTAYKCYNVSPFDTGIHLTDDKITPLLLAGRQPFVIIPVDKEDEIGFDELCPDEVPVQD